MKFINEEMYKDKIGIYKIVNKINNKIYIGKTEDRFIERFWNHVWKLNNNKHDNKYLQNSWNKHGENKFEFEVVKECNIGQNINKLEECYIELYDSYKNGYNLTLGGEGTKGNFPSEESKKIVAEKNRKRNLGKRHSEDTKKKMSNSHKGRVKTQKHRNNLSKSLTGKSVSIETRNKLREINTGSNSPVTKLAEDDVISIKKRLLRKDNQKDIANSYDVSLGVISAIANNRTWIHVFVDGWEEYISNKKTIVKLSINDVMTIKKLLKDGLNCSEIARTYGVYSSTISGIKNEKYFKDVTI